MSVQVLQILTQALEMGYPVSKRSRDRSYSFRTDKDSEGNPKITKLLLPWFRTCPEPATCRQEWAELRDRQRLSVMYVFPAYMPPGLFELMTVRAYAEKYKLAFLAHWGGGVHARHTGGKSAPGHDVLPRGERALGGRRASTTGTRRKRRRRRRRTDRPLAGDGLPTEARLLGGEKTAPSPDTRTLPPGRQTRTRRHA